MSRSRDPPRSLPRRVAVRTLQLLAIVVAVLGVATARVVYSGEREIAASTAALVQGDPREATVRARRAARWYAPGAPHVQVAYDRLKALARAAEQNRRPDIALFAWRSVRLAALETRWIYTPHAADMALAEREIARLSKAKTTGTAHGPLNARALQAAAGQSRQGPRLVWAIALVAAFVLWTAGIALWARQVAGIGGKVRWTKAKAATVLTLVGVGLWLLALWRA